MIISWKEQLKTAREKQRSSRPLGGHRWLRCCRRAGLRCNTKKLCSRNVHYHYETDPPSRQGRCPMSSVRNCL